MNTRKRFSILALSVALLLLVVACATVPITGRKQFNLVSDGEMNAMSFQQYNQVISESQLSNDPVATEMIKRVGGRIQLAAETYFGERGESRYLDGYAWEFHLIESEQMNAWCMPGGKVAFYTGILPVCQDEAGVAVVMGHEIAHAIAKHGSERMSHGMALQLGGMALGQALQNKPAQTQQLFMSAFAIGAQFGAMLPFSRQHESEADHMGLIFMAMAGYDPRTAPSFWQRMSAGGGAKPPEFMSTHPADETRIRNLNERMAEALQYYKP